MSILFDLMGQGILELRFGSAGPGPDPDPDTNAILYSSSEDDPITYSSNADDHITWGA